MNKPTILYSAFVLILTLVCASLSAQNSTINYDLSNYKLPYLKRHVLEFDFNLGGSYRNNKIQRDDLDARMSISRTYSANINPSYTFTLNSKKLQIYNSASVYLPNLSYNYYSSENPGRINKATTINPELSYYGEFREYVTNKFFFEQDLNLSSSYRNNSSYDEYKYLEQGIDRSNKEDEIYHHLSSDLSFLVGWGRIERVEDARLAVYILDDLKKAGQLSREVSEEEITLLAKRISEVQNERFFDSRHKKIWELQQIDSLLMEMDLIESGNIYYYTLLNDNWDFSSGPIRNTGFIISGGVSTDLSNSRNLTQLEENDYILDTMMYSEIESKNRGLGIGPVFTVYYEKSINLYWQFYIRNHMRISREFAKTEYKTETNDVASYKNSIISNQFNTGFGYFPNSRTAIQLSLSENYNFQNNTSEDDINSKTHSLRSALNLYIEYYLSPQLRLYINSSIHHVLSTSKSDTNELKDRSINCDLHASLIYKIL